MNYGRGRRGFGLAWVPLCMLLALAAGFMLYSSYRETAIFDETAHIPAGYAYVRYLDYRLNPEHPPLVKALSGLALLTYKPSLPIATPAWQGINEQWQMGGDFFYRSGNDADRLIRTARLGPIALALLLILVVYLWSARIVGRWWALLPATIAALSPTMLAHGHYVTTDVGAALGIMLAAWSFTTLLERPSRKQLWIAGVAFGLAQLLKFSAILLIPYFGLLAFAFWLITGRKNALLILKNTVLAGIIGLVVVIYPAYALFTAGMPAKLETPEAVMMPLLKTSTDPQGLAGIMVDAGKLLANYSATKPLAHYALGLAMVFERSAYGNTAYFMGEISTKGSKAYFPLIYLMKEPLPVLLFLLLPLLALVVTASRRLLQGTTWSAVTQMLREHFAVVAMLLFSAIYWATSIQSPLNIGVRHLLPAIPLLYMAATPWWRNWIMRNPSPKGDVFEKAGMMLRSFMRSWLKLSFLAALLLWLLVGTASAAPHFLSYFNEAAGGTANGYRYATDSNYDWGQDLGELARWADAHPDEGRIAVDYFGGGDIKHYLGDRGEPWWSSRGNPKDQGVSWLAISVNTLQGAIQPAAADFGRKPEDEYRWLTDARPKAPGIGGVPPPDARAGTSIFLYRLR